MASPTHSHASSGSRRSIGVDEQHDDEISSSPNFVSLTTPTQGDDKNPSSSSLKHTASIGAQSDHQLDSLGSLRPPQLRIALIPRQLAFYVVATSVFLTLFTAVSYYGIVVHRIVEDVGTANSEAEELVELYNTFSGFALALIEVLLGLFMHNFLQVFLVYLHNSLWFLHGNPVTARWSNRLRSTLMFLFPVILLLLIGNSLRSLQASQSTVGFEPIMKINDLQREQSIVETLDTILDDIDAASKNRTAIAAKAAAIARNSTASGKKNATAVSVPGQAVDIGILKNAVEGTSVPFSINTSSVCSAGNQTKSTNFKLNVNDLDSTNVVYGFTPHEWNKEALGSSPNYTARMLLTYNSYAAYRKQKKTQQIPDGINLKLAFDMFAQGKIMLDKSIAATQADFVPCKGYKTASSKSGKAASRRLDESEDDDDSTATSKIDASAKCQVAHKTLLKIGEYRKQSDKLTAQNFYRVIYQGLNSSIDGLLPRRTNVSIATYNLTDDIRMDMLVIELSMKIPTESEFFTSERVYEYEHWGSEFCGSDNCVFIDKDNNFRVPRQIVLLPFNANCTFREDTIRYSADLRGFFPSDCVKQNNSALAFGLSSYIEADEYGSNFAYRNRSKPAEEGSPYLIYPRRSIRLVMAKLSWKTKDLAKNFDVDCRREQESGQSCKGLSYKLPRSGRYVFTSEDAIPTENIRKASLINPGRLVQLNDATMYVDDWKQVVIPERLQWRTAAGVYERTRWRNQSLGNTSCSMLIDSYIAYINRNNYYLERPVSAVYRAAFFYLFSNGSVTELNDTTILVNATAGQANLTEYLTDNSLNNIKLKGDVQLRKIRVTVPKSSVKATLGGCALLLFIAVIVVVLPTRRVEYFPTSTSKAMEYIIMSNTESYPDSVHHKTLLFPNSDDSMSMKDFAVDEMTLVHRQFPDQEVKL